MGVATKQKRWLMERVRYLNKQSNSQLDFDVSAYFWLIEIPISPMFSLNHLRLSKLVSKYSIKKGFFTQKLDFVQN